MPCQYDPAPTVDVGRLTPYAEIARYWNSQPGVRRISRRRVEQICRQAERKLRVALKDIKRDYE